MWSRSDTRHRTASTVESNCPDSEDDIPSMGQTACAGARTFKRHAVRHRGEILFSGETLVAFAEKGLGYDLAPVRRALTAVLRAERGVTSDAEATPDELTVFAFALTVAPQLVAEEWTAALAAVVEPYAVNRALRFTIYDREHNVAIRVVRGEVVAVRVLKKRAP